MNMAAANTHMRAGACRKLGVYGTTSTLRYPYFSSNYQRQNNLPESSCWNSESPACASLATNTTLLYKLPLRMTRQKSCHLSESQLVRVSLHPSHFKHNFGCDELDTAEN